MGIETAITGFLVKLGVGAKTAATIAGAVVAIGQYAVVAAATSYVTKQGLKGSPDLQARTVTSRGTIDPQKKVYGEALVGGTLAYHQVHGIRNRDMWAVHLLAGHQISGITDVYLDDQAIQNSFINGGAAAGGAVTNGDYGPARGQNVVEIYKYLGTDTQTANAELSAATIEWGTDYRLRGLAYAITKFTLWDRTEKLWEAGDPTDVKFLVQGALIYDPRLDSTMVIDSTTSPETLGSGAHRNDDPTTWAYSDNPALCLADYLMDAKFSPLAEGVNPSRIDWEACAKAADVCDALVPVPPVASPLNTEKRFTCNGVIYGSATPEENIESILSSMNGTLVFSNGLYIINAASYEAPASGDDLDEDNIIGPISIRNALDSESRVNSLKANFVDPARKYQVNETAVISFSAYKDVRDGGDELIETLELPMTNSHTMAQRICQLQLQQSNEELSVSVPCNLYAARFVPGQRINLNVTELGWTPKIFKVLSWEFFDRGGNQIGVNLNLREDSAAAYADPDETEYNTQAQNGVLTFADPQPLPSIDTVPNVGAAHYGEGAWNIELNRNTDALGSSDDGEIRITAGLFVLPDAAGSQRQLSANAEINTPWEASAVPPDGTFYLIWGATNPDTRFGSQPWGDATAEAAGLFSAVYDRLNEQWYAVHGNNTDGIAFTMASSDYVIARGIKTSLTGGIDALTPIVAFVEDPRATRGAGVGEGVTALNTGFELGDQNWTLPTNVAIVESTPNHGGDWHAECTETASATRVGKNGQLYPCSEGSRFAFGGYIRFNSSRAGGALQWQISWRNGAGTELSTSLATNVAALAADTWHASFGTAVAPANAEFAVLEFVSWTQSAGESYFDDGFMFPNDNIDSAGESIPDELLRNDQVVTNALGALNANPGFEIPRLGALGEPAPASWYGVGSAVALRYVSNATRDEVQIPGAAGLNIVGAAFRPEVGTEYEIAVLARKTNAGDGTRLEVTVSEYDTELLATGKRAIVGTTAGSGADDASLLQLRTREKQLINPTPDFAAGDDWDLSTTYAIYTGRYSATSTTKWASINIDAANNDGSPQAAGDMHLEWVVMRERSTRNQVIVGFDELGSSLSLPTTFGTPELSVEIDAGDDVTEAELVVTVDVDWGYTAADSDDSSRLLVTIAHYDTEVSPRVQNSPGSASGSFYLQGVPTSSAFTSFFGHTQTSMTRRFSPNVGLNAIEVDLRKAGAGSDAPITAQTAEVTVQLFRR